MPNQFFYCLFTPSCNFVRTLILPKHPKLQLCFTSSIKCGVSQNYFPFSFKLWATFRSEQPISCFLSYIMSIMFRTWWCSMKECNTYFTKQSFQTAYVEFKWYALCMQLLLCDAKYKDHATSPLPVCLTLSLLCHFFGNTIENLVRNSY